MNRLLYVILFLSSSLLCQAQVVRDTTLQSSDDIALDAFYLYPSTSPPAGGYPAVLLVHGFGGNKGNNASLARGFAEAGCVATSYSVRGQGASGGEFDFFTSDNLLADLQLMIDFTKALPNVNTERVGVMGGSQGGLHAWNAAAFDMGVRAVISVVANGRFRENWYEDGALNWTFAAASLSPNVRFASHVLDSITRARESGDFTYLDSYLTNASTRDREHTATTPVLMISSYYDGFFDPNAALRQFARIAGPKRIVMYPAGHSMPGDPVQSAFVNDLSARWMDYWLKDDVTLVSVVSEDSAVVMFDAGSGDMHVYGLDDQGYWMNTGTADAEKLSEYPLFFTDDGLTSNSQVTLSQRQINYVNILGSQAQVFQTAPLQNDLTISAREGSAQIQLSGTGSTMQVNLLLFDVDPGVSRKPITRGHMQLAGGADRMTSFELNTAVHTVKAGHVIEAQVHCGMALLPTDGRDFGNYVVGPVDNSISSISYGGDADSRVTLNVYDDAPVSVLGEAYPDDMTLGQNYPNPFTSSTTLPISMKQSGYCSLIVYDSRGREAAVLHDGFLAAGRHTAHFHAGSLPAGMYSVVLRTGAGTQRRSMLLIR